MDKQQWDNWMTDWNWIIKVAQDRQWSFNSLEIQPPIELSEIELIEQAFSISYPTDFKAVLANYSSAVQCGWQLTDEEIPEEFISIFCGCGGVSAYKSQPNLWDFGLLAEMYKTYQGWLTNCYNDPTDAYGKHYYNKIPFIEVPNGDFIAFNELGEVCYLSHDDGPLHGERLAANFVEFITLWSNLGCVGTESEQLAVFYDTHQEKLMDAGEQIERWKAWLAK